MALTFDEDENLAASDPGQVLVVRRPVKHPAKFSASILTELDQLFDKYGRSGPTLDPFAGVGRVHSLNVGCTVGVELEPEWATQHPRTLTGNALHLPFRPRSFRRLVTSVTYANRMADCHDAQERCKPCGGTGIDETRWHGTGSNICQKCRGEGRRYYQRNTYKHTLGRPLHPDNSGAMQWGNAYRDFHTAAYREAIESLDFGAHFFLNISDHIRDHKVVPVSAWHRDTLTGLGLTHLETVEVPTRRNRQGANYKARVEHEDIHVFRTPGAA